MQLVSFNLQPDLAPKRSKESEIMQSQNRKSKGESLSTLDREVQDYA